MSMKQLRKNRQIAVAAAAVALTITIVGCETPMNPPPQSTGKFAQIESTVFPNCTTSGCHSGDTPSNGLSLEMGEAYDQLVNVAAQNATASAAGKKRVVPGDAANSFLYQKLTGNLADFEGKQMPRDLPPLSNDQITLVEEWINEGAVR